MRGGLAVRHGGKQLLHQPLALPRRERELVGHQQALEGGEGVGRSAAHGGGCGSGAGGARRRKCQRQLRALGGRQRVARPHRARQLLERIRGARGAGGRMLQRRRRAPQL